MAMGECIVGGLAAMTAASLLAISKGVRKNGRPSHHSLLVAMSFFG